MRWVRKVNRHLLGFETRHGSLLISPNSLEPDIEYRIKTCHLYKCNHMHQYTVRNPKLVNQGNLRTKPRITAAHMRSGVKKWREEDM